MIILTAPRTTDLPHAILTIEAQIVIRTDTMTGAPVDKETIDDAIMTIPLPILANALVVLIIEMLETMLTEKNRLEDETQRCNEKRTLKNKNLNFRVYLYKDPLYSIHTVEQH